MESNFGIEEDSEKDIGEDGNCREKNEKQESENRASFMARFEGIPKDIIMLIDLAYDLSKEAHRPQKGTPGNAILSIQEAWH